MENNIFISYSHRDIETVKEIAGIIQKASNMTVWWDDSLRGGENYFSVIANQIIKSKFFVFIVSDNSVMSDWCLRELEFAASERKIIVAIWLDNISISPRVKLVIQNTHYINYYSATNDMFFSAVSRAFLENAHRTETSYGENDEGRSLTWNETYFIDGETLKKISGLLSQEKQNKYSVCFQPENAFMLGLAYELGIKVDSDPRRAEFYYRVSACKGNYDGKYLYAAIRLKQPDADTSALLSEMIDAAEHKSIYALTYLGDDYRDGRNGCDKDLEKAYAFWKEAAEMGSAAAMYYMSYGYRNGEYFKKDIDLAYMYALMALEYEFPRAYRIIAFMYEEGELFEQNYQKAIEFYEEAIKRGDYLSLCYEGWIYGEKKDYDKKRELYERAANLAEEGKIKSGLPFFRMGYIYEYGEGVPKDTIKAVEYYLRASERKNNSALKYTVETIMTISGQKQKEAYLNKAYELGCKGAAYELGNLEKSKGDGKKLSEEAVKFYVNGAESGDMRCVIELLNNYSFIFGKGSSNDRNDRAESIKWFQFLFAHADEEFLNTLRENSFVLATYYYAYALELDYNPDVNLPDREFVRLYFEKSLNESQVHLNKIVSFVVDGYLFPEESSSGLLLDVVHSEEMLSLLKNYLAAYYKYIIHDDASNSSQLWDSLMENFERGYNKISECYLYGKTVQRDRAKAKQYKAAAEEIIKIMNGIAEENHE